MRSLLTVGCLILVAGVAVADKPRPATSAERKAGATVSTDGTGKVRSIAPPTLKAGAAQKAPPTGEKPAERAAAAPPVAPPAAPLVDEDISRELVLKQMRRYEKSIGACTAASHKRGKNGEVQLSLDIVERHVTPSVVKDTTGDPMLSQCLTVASRGWVLPAAHLTLPWTVTVK